MAKTFQLSLAPQKLWQAINPWTFNQQINIDLGQSADPEVERAVLDEVGSYGRQIGRIEAALEVVLNHVKLDGLSPAEQDALAALRYEISAVRELKRRVRGRSDPKRG
jgi:hypothetical protein